jgi:dipeptidyl aminopeptidase/acylaminoacyl peptidase
VIDSTRSRPQLLRDHKRVFLTIESLMYAGRVHCPVLILHGGSDITVPIRSAERIANAIRSSGNSGVTVRIILGVSHSLLPNPFGPNRSWVYLPAFATSPQLLE